MQRFNHLHRFYAITESHENGFADTSADAYAQVDRFLKASDTAQNGVRSKRGVPKSA